MEPKVRHICGISGGKDSSAMAVYMSAKVPQMEYFFCDTGAELPETYEYLDRLEVTLGKPIERLNSNKGFDHYPIMLFIIGYKFSCASNMPYVLFTLA